MQLKDRKRINNIQRFNSGFDSNTVFNSILNTQNQNQLGLGSNLITNSYFNNNGTNNVLNMDYVRGAAANIGKVKAEGNNASASSSATGAAISKTGNVIGSMFNQNQKFTDTASNNWKTIGDTIQSEVPGAYGQAIGGGLNLISDYTGMRNYKISGSQMQNNSGTENAQVGGINYIRQGIPDTYKAYKDVSNTATKNTIAMTGKGAATGAAVGSIIPGLGTVAGGIIGSVAGLIGGLFGGSAARKRQRRINRNAQIATNMINQEQDAYASSEAILNKYYQNNNDTTDDILLANKGKDLNYNRRLNYRKLTKRHR